jgi:GTP-binding protein
VLYRIVLTKADAVKKADLVRKQAEITALARKHPAALSDILTTSSDTGMGIAELRADLAALAQPAHS